MEVILIALAALFVAFIVRSVYQGKSIEARATFIDTYSFPPKVKSKVLEHHPELTSRQADKVIKGLREYFYLCNEARGKFVSMPSEAVDTAWHEFILFTRQYKDFCNKAFGQFLHHSPAEGPADSKKVQKGIRTAWRLSCARSNINPAKPAALPMLFAMDTALGIENGIYYQLDCSNAPTISGKQPHCATHMGCGGCGGSGGSNDNSGCGGGGDGGGCGGGCGG